MTERTAPLTYARLGLAGHVEWQVRDRDGHVAQRGARDNLILDQGLNQIAARYIAQCFTHCAVGTGNSAPDVAQTGLDLEIARTANYLTGDGDCGSQRVDPVTWQMKRTFDFPLGALDSSQDGQYLEVGFSHTGSAGANLFSRALFESAGQPAAISVQSDQQLRVVYTLTIHCAPAAVTSGSVAIDGIGDVPFTHAIQNLGFDGYDTNIVSTAFSGIDGDGRAETATRDGRAFLEPHIDTYYTGQKYFTIMEDTSALVAPGYIDFTPSGSAPTLAAQPAAYQDGAFYRDVKCAMSVNQANFAISRVHIGGRGDYDRKHAYAVRFDSPLAKDNQHTLDLVFRLSWGRA